MSDLPAGPELDRAIAEKVMGGQRGDPFNPSTNIAHAWEVLEHCARHYGVFLRIGPAEADVFTEYEAMALGSHKSEQYGEDNGVPSLDHENWVEVAAATAPLAICLAALRGVSGQGHRASIP